MTVTVIGMEMSQPWLNKGIVSHPRDTDPNAKLPPLDNYGVILFTVDGEYQQRGQMELLLDLSLVKSKRKE